jgi:rod shape-determining protein MreD
LTAVLFISLATMIVAIVQTASIGLLIPAAYKPDVMLILVVWASLRLTRGIGMSFAFVAGLLMDILSGSPMGLFALIYCVCFVMCDVANSTFDIDRPAGRALTTLGVTILAGGTVLLTRWLTGPTGTGLHTIVWILSKSLITGLSSLVLFPVLDRSWTSCSKLVGVR